MWRLVFFIPLIALTVYILIRSQQDLDEDDDFTAEKEHLCDLAIRMLYKGRDYADRHQIECEFASADFSDPQRPLAEFTLFTDRKSIPFKAENGNLIRYKDK